MMNFPPKNNAFLCILLTVINLTSLNLLSQDKVKKDSLKAISYQETVFSHLNKSTYIKGEEIGITSYVFNKETKKLSTLATNLYCTISDSENKIIKSKLFKIENGVAVGSFVIDSPFKTDTYTVKTYTNWMLNFDAKNYFVEKIKIIDPSFIKAEKKTVKSTKIDVQYLPESGTLLKNVNNTIGVIAKDSLGYGVPNLKGEVFENDIKIIDFNLNNLGIGRFSLIPKNNSIYTTVINYEGKVVKNNITQLIKNNGIVLKVSKSREDAFISIVTNQQTLNEINGKNYFLIFNAKKETDRIAISFDDKTTVTNKIKLTKIPSGLNTVTLVNSDNIPIAERVFFNYENLSFLKIKETSIVNLQDTSNVKIQLNKELQFKNGSVSISVLPTETKSYQKNANIITQTLLQPHLNSLVENGGYYFKDINYQKEYDLDNLLITQGWSSFNWKLANRVGNSFSHKFEKGISFKVNIANLESKSSYLLHPTKSNSGKIIDFTEEIKSFQLYSYFPKKDEFLSISKRGRKGTLEKPNGLYLQFFPSNIPRFNKDNSSIEFKKPFEKEVLNLNDLSNFYAMNKVTLLDEVVVKANLKEERYKKIRAKSSGRVFFLDKINKSYTLANFLDFQPGVSARDDFMSGTFRAVNKIKGKPITVYLDGDMIVEPFTLFNYFLNDVEYIDISIDDISGGFMGGTGGVIRIQTDPLVRNTETLRKFNFPLTFNENQRFYVPKYESVQSRFYKNYGVIDWLPNNNINDDGTVNIKFNHKKQNSVKLFIEGVTDQGNLISEEVIVNIKK